MMRSDASSPQPHRPSSWSPARRQSEADLLTAIERSGGRDDAPTRSALRAFVEVLADEGLPPEGAVIAVKDALGRAHFLTRVEPLIRDQLRTTLVSVCIDHYFERGPRCG